LRRFLLTAGGPLAYATTPRPPVFGFWLVLVAFCRNFWNFRIFLVFRRKEAKDLSLIKRRV
jgi:hypothetical protein